MSNSLFSSLNTPKRKLFLSYHHKNDRDYYDEFLRFFSGTYDVIQDNSVDRVIDSDNVDYVIRQIRENYISGTSCTIVLCGSETPWRKFVDWEIKATLDKQHGLIGINLPSNPIRENGNCTVPNRLFDNINSAYGVWIQWADLKKGPQFLTQKIEEANAKSKFLISNTRSLRKRNG